MSVMIESTDELLKLLKKMNLKVGSVDELRQLLASINASYNPDAARQKTGRQIGTIVPSVMAAAAAFTSFCLLPSQAPPEIYGLAYVIGLPVIWGAVVLVSTAAVISAAIMTRVRRSRAIPDHSLARPVPHEESVVTHITGELSL